MEFLRGPLAFEWDAGNQEKNFRKHRVTNTECEEVFFDPHKRILKELLHGSGANQEKRNVLIGRTKGRRAPYLVFTVRSGRVRVISARDLNRKERRLLP